MWPVEIIAYPEIRVSLDALKTTPLKTSNAHAVKKLPPSMSSQARLKNGSLNRGTKGKKCVGKSRKSVPFSERKRRSAVSKTDQVEPENPTEVVNKRPEPIKKKAAVLLHTLSHISGSSRDTFQCELDPIIPVTESCSPKFDINAPSWLKDDLSISACQSAIKDAIFSLPEAISDAEVIVSSFYSNVSEIICEEIPVTSPLCSPAEQTRRRGQTKTLRKRGKLPALEETELDARIQEIESRGISVDRKLVKRPEPTRPKTSWDFVLEEMLWISNEISSERKWKISTAKKVAKAIQRQFQQKDVLKLKAIRDEENKRKRAAAALARIMRDFWTNMGKLVEHRTKVIVEGKRRRALDWHLNYVVDQTEKLSSMMAESLTTDSPRLPLLVGGASEELEARIDRDENVEDSVNNQESTLCMKPEKAATREERDIYSEVKARTPSPFLLKHTLREYQHIGLDWLVTLYERNLNGILADEMGLGKTIQTIALLAHLACVEGNWGPHLIVVPTSVLLNWEQEMLKWLPGLKLLTYYGTQKERKQKRAGWTKRDAFHVCITSYQLILQDHVVFRRKKWRYLILDEAHNIKNFKSQRWQVLLHFHSERRLLLTGTPLQNNLLELWSLMHFLMPQVFQSHSEFREWFSDPVSGMIDGSQRYNASVIRRLHKVLRPFLLRRLKSEVEKQLPRKHEHVVMCRLSKRQQFLYEDYMSRSKTRDTLDKGNLLSVINVLMQLRKVCNHPNLFEERPVVSPLLCDPLFISMPSLITDDLLAQSAKNGLYLPGLGIESLVDSRHYSSWDATATTKVMPSSLESLLKKRRPVLRPTQNHSGTRLRLRFGKSMDFGEVMKPCKVDSSLVEDEQVMAATPGQMQAKQRGEFRERVSASEDYLNVQFCPLFRQGKQKQSSEAKELYPKSDLEMRNGALFLGDEKVLPTFWQRRNVLPDSEAVCIAVVPLPFPSGPIKRYEVKQETQACGPQMKCLQSVTELPTVISPKRRAGLGNQPTKSFVVNNWVWKAVNRERSVFQCIKKADCQDLVTRPEKPKSGNSEKPEDEERLLKLPATVSAGLDNGDKPANGGKPKYPEVLEETELDKLNSDWYPNQRLARRAKILANKANTSQSKRKLPAAAKKGRVGVPTRPAVKLARKRKTVSSNTQSTKFAINNSKPVPLFRLPECYVRRIGKEYWTWMRSVTNYERLRYMQPMMFAWDTLLACNVAQCPAKRAFLTRLYQGVNVFIDANYELNRARSQMLEVPVSGLRPGYVGGLEACYWAMRCGQSQLAGLCKSPVQVQRDMQEMLAKFSIYVPPVIPVAPVSLQLSHPGCRRRLKDSAFLHRLRCVLTGQPGFRSQLAGLCKSPVRVQRDMQEMLAKFRPTASANFLRRKNVADATHNCPVGPKAQAPSLLFPELRLIEYDCGKLQALAQLLRKLKQDKHRVLIFTQMSRVLDVLEAFLNFHGYRYLRLDGATKVDDRQTMMQEFNENPSIFCFILSTRSGGIGVNLTGADTVIFYDSDWNPTMDAQAQDRCHRIGQTRDVHIYSDWNPTMDAQAQDRCHRIGQTRDVHIYRLISERTVEENILRKANQKRLMVDLAIENGNFTTAHFKMNTIHDLFSVRGVEESVSEALLGGPEMPVKDADRNALEAALLSAEDYVDAQAATCAYKEVELDLTLDHDPDVEVEHVCCLNFVGKLQALAQLLRKLKQDKHRVLIFTQMSRVLDVLEAFLNFHGYRYLRLDGATKVDDRQTMMQEFNENPSIFCFILSTRSGGIGVNLTGADTVIFYDSDWNPTMDAQAQDRCHRIGQTRDVHIYRLISERTVEENILRKANQKRLMVDLAIENGNFTTAHFKMNTIHDLFSVRGVEESVSEALLGGPEMPVKDADRNALEAALLSAEDYVDAQAATCAYKEVELDLTLDHDPDVEVEHVSRQELTPVETYALKCVEKDMSQWTEEQILCAEQEIEKQKKEWEQNHLNALHRSMPEKLAKPVSSAKVRSAAETPVSQVSTSSPFSKKTEKPSRFSSRNKACEKPEAKPCSYLPGMEPFDPTEEEEEEQPRTTKRRTRDDDDSSLSNKNKPNRKRLLSSSLLISPTKRRKKLEPRSDALKSKNKSGKRRKSEPVSVGQDKFVMCKAPPPVIVVGGGGGGGGRGSVSSSSCSSSSSSSSSSLSRSPKTKASSAAAQRQRSNKSAINACTARTRSGGGVAINLWTLDVDPVLPGIRPVAKMNTSATDVQAADKSHCCEGENDRDCLPLSISKKDYFYGKHYVNCLEFKRSCPVILEGCRMGRREQTNAVTPVLDLSLSYGSSYAEENALRNYARDTCHLPEYTDKCSACEPFCYGPNCLPFGAPPHCFSSGDNLRMMQEPSLFAFQVVKSKAHNRLATDLRYMNPHWNCEKVFQEAKKILIGLYNHIIISEYLPALLAPSTLDKYGLRPARLYRYDYDPYVNPGVWNPFGQAAFRFGHSKVPDYTLLLDYDFKVLEKDPYWHWFERPERLIGAETVNWIVLGASQQPSLRTDEWVSTQVSQLMFNMP
ncbi:unnamed protein product [Notodromas monacha]|uniref:Uncharacterized protein n=1 Tax=Notodromas monacha TaxID=399045 RepID=A0A7R9BX84_9CRUS|nr:unnamed protein product [Notodromas monacha]CAG0922333.1 unnamed protein product [Notodromas monacha]